MSDPILRIENVTKTYAGRSGLFGRAAPVQALKGVSLDVTRGQSFGLVGESGSGKTTLTRSILRLEEPTSGRILFEGQDMAKLSAKALRALRARVQIVFQDPYASLNPRMSVGQIVTEPMAIHHDLLRLSAAQQRERAAELLTLVGLGPQHLGRHPHEFSGGQRQRIGIARALAMDPDLIIADEAVSALDVSIQAQVLDLLRDLRDRLNLSILFITHDLRVAAQLCDRIAVMQKGKLVEIGPASDVFLNPQHDYTRTLLAAVPGGGWGQAAE